MTEEIRAGSVQQRTLRLYRPIQLRRRGRASAAPHVRIEVTHVMDQRCYLVAVSLCELDDGAVRMFSSIVARRVPTARFWARHFETLAEQAFDPKTPFIVDAVARLRKEW